ncbi:MAG: LapA family protein [Magnetospirillum sp.]|nr:LapA family protein [Magnetospirillum sp.]
MRALGWIVAVAIALLSIVFAVSNRQPVALELWPLPWSLTLPLYLAVFGALVLGMAVGAVAAWASGRGTRRRARDQKRRADSLARQLETAGPSSERPAEPRA